MWHLVQPHVHRLYTFRVHVKEILSIRLEFSRFYSTRFIQNRIFTHPEVTIATFIVTEVDKCNICVPGHNKLFNVALCGNRLPNPGEV